jgi:hypothetical protein
MSTEKNYGLDFIKEVKAEITKEDIEIQVRNWAEEKIYRSRIKDVIGNMFQEVYQQENIDPDELIVSPDIFATMRKWLWIGTDMIQEHDKEKIKKGIVGKIYGANIRIQTGSNGILKLTTKERKPAEV